MPETTRAEQMFGDFAPKLVSLTTDVLFADIWERAELESRDRSLITVAALIATGSTEQLPGHLARALANGLTRPSSRRSSPTSRSTPDGQKQCPQWPSRSGIRELADPCGRRYGRGESLATCPTAARGTSFRVGTGLWSHARTDPLCAAWREDERRTWRRVVSDRSESPRARALDAVQPRSEMRGVAWEQGPARS